VHSFAIAAGVLIVLIVLWDAFETTVLPRRVSRRFRLTRIFYRTTWIPFRAIARGIRSGNPRENFLSIFGPLSLILLLVTWAFGLIVGFALLHWGLGSHLTLPAGISGFRADLYLSGTTFFTLGLGDVAPTSGASRVLTVVEGGMGFGFLALVIGYLPVLSQAFSRREATIALLDARAGSPPTAAELLRRHGSAEGAEALVELFREWERWSAELLESHVSFPVLAYYRSQHDNQSWVAALTTILDVCSLIVSGIEGAPTRDARLAFAMARHAVVDLARVFNQAPGALRPDRLPEAELGRLKQALASAGMPLKPDAGVAQHLLHHRQMYEPYVHALSEFLLMPLPAWLPPAGAKDNWQVTQ
jgi:Ion channel